MTLMNNLDIIIYRSNILQDRIRGHLDQALAKLKLDNDAVILYKEKLHEIIVKIVKLIEDKILVHPLVEKVHGIARNIILDAYRKCLPYLAKISENSLLAGGLSFGLGVILSYWIFSIYFNNYYKSVMKKRTMSGVTANYQYGGIESLNLRSDLIVPRITRPNQVLVRVHAASVDVTDISILSGLGKTERKMSQDQKIRSSNVAEVVLGRDFSGVVLDVGRNVSNVEVGDTVWSAQPIALNGTLSEFVVIDSNTVRLKPVLLNHDGAATLPYSSLLVWDALVNQARIQPKHGLRNKRVLIVDAGSPTGCIAIQVCKAWEGKVTACCSKRVVPLAKLLGAEQIVALPHDPEEAEMICEEKFQELSYSYDLCILTLEDSTLSDYFCQQFCHSVVKTNSTRRLASDGYGMARGWLLSWWRSFSFWSSQYHYLNVRPLDHFAQLVQEGKLQPVLDSAYAYEQAEEAFQATASTSTVGKIIITFGLRGHREPTRSDSHNHNLKK